MPKTNYYTFGSSASRDQVNKVFNPMDNSPRGTESRQIPGPGEYKYKNNSFGTEGRRFSFLQKTKYSQGKHACNCFLSVCKIVNIRKSPSYLLSIIRMAFEMASNCDQMRRSLHLYYISYLNIFCIVY